MKKIINIFLSLFRCIFLNLMLVITNCDCELHIWSSFLPITSFYKKVTICFPIASSTYGTAELWLLTGGTVFEPELFFPFDWVLSALGLLDAKGVFVPTSDCFCKFFWTTWGTSATFISLGTDCLYSSAKSSEQRNKRFALLDEIDAEITKALESYVLPKKNKILCKNTAENPLKTISFRWVFFYHFSFVKNVFCFWPLSKIFFLACPLLSSASNFQQFHYKDICVPC